MTIVCLGQPGSGKSTLVQYFQQHFGIPKLLQYTTRQLRQNERNGKNYYFISTENMDVLESKIDEKYDALIKEFERMT